MDGDVLSQAEVESLLAAIERPEAQRRAGGSLHGKTMPYDFKRPERVGKEQMRALQTMYEAFSRNFGAALSALLRAIVEVKLTSVDQLTYSEFVFSLENPTCFNIIEAEPLEGYLILDINPSILYLIIDRLLGGGRETAEMSRRPLTEIELRLVARVTDLFLREMKHSWEHILELNARVDRVESNPQLAQIVSPNEVVVLISFELTIGETRGMMNFCLPFNAIERISNKLTANNWSTVSKRPVSPEAIRKISVGITGAVVEVVAELAHTRITTGDLIGLRVGDIITTEKDIHNPLDIKVEGCSKLHASAGAYKGHKAIQIVADAGP
jgi:flagellar motor switch protein FliM